MPPMIAPTTSPVTAVKSVIQPIMLPIIAPIIIYFPIGPPEVLFYVKRMERNLLNKKLSRREQLVLFDNIYSTMRLNICNFFTKYLMYLFCFLNGTFMGGDFTSNDCMLFYINFFSGYWNVNRFFFCNWFI